ncbi:glycosyltransferase [Kitasatospora sp. NPDC058218]|uniref:glycosyltransferase n=1 Tax=Kitasatospora sp. NPDC058218 TaxID=3346385 RepID=UPI0036DF12B9
MPYGETRKELRASIVVPTWNESQWLPGLLGNLQSLGWASEIIVADNNSSDGTQQIALMYRCRLIEGGSPAQARNKGARHAMHELIIFMDADAAARRSVFDRVFEAFAKDTSIVAVHFPLLPIGGTLFIRACYRFMNGYIGTLSRLGIAQGVGTFIAVRRSAFESIGGFDEHLMAGEDADLLRRLQKTGHVRYERSEKVGTSTRRFRIENPIAFAIKTATWGILRLLGLRFSPWGYRWMPYPVEIGARDRRMYSRFLMKNEGSDDVQCE